jgi:hypothetical protein
MLTSRYRSLIAACVLALTATAAQAQASAPGGPLTVRPTAADTSVAQRATVQYRKLWTGAKPGARAYDIDAHPSVSAGSSSGGHAQIRFPGDMSYQGGAVITNNVAHAIYLLPDDRTCPTTAACWGNPEKFLADLGKSGFVHVTDQYVGTSAFNRYTVGQAAHVPYHRPANPFTDLEMQAVIHAVVTHAKTVQTGYGNIYHVFLPPGQDECFDSSFTICASTVFCAYHSSVDFPDIGHVVYSIEPYLNVFGCQSAPNGPNGQLADSTYSALSHETIEAITDPDGLGWWNTENGGMFGEEIGDECVFLTFDSNGNFLYFDDDFVSLNGAPYLIQPEYNNHAHACTAGVVSD